MTERPCETCGGTGAKTIRVSKRFTLPNGLTCRVTCGACQGTGQQPEPKEGRG